MLLRSRRFQRLLMLIAASRKAHAFIIAPVSNIPRLTGWSSLPPHFLKSGVKLTADASILRASSSLDEELLISNNNTDTDTTASDDRDNEVEDFDSPNEDGQTTDDDNFDNILRTRRTVNNFHPDLPKNWRDILHDGVRSAITAPNHKLSEPWRFRLLGPATIKKVCELNAALVSQKKGMTAGTKKLERWLRMPGWLVVTCRTTTTVAGGGSMDAPASREREDYAACCCAIQNLCLSLHNKGMGTKWTTGPVNFHPRFGEIVGLEDGEYVVGTLWFGVPEDVPRAPMRKRDLEDVFIEHD